MFAGDIILLLKFILFLTMLIELLLLLALLFLVAPVFAVLAPRFLFCFFSSTVVLKSNLFNNKCFKHDFGSILVCL